MRLLTPRSPESERTVCGGAPQTISLRWGAVRRLPVDLDPDVADEAPSAPTITPYDEQHYVTYMRLLDASRDKADWAEAARIILHRDPVTEEARTLRCWESHLARAQWLSKGGYRRILEQAIRKDL